jgi:hypothetical protein
MFPARVPTIVEDQNGTWAEMFRRAGAGLARTRVPSIGVPDVGTSPAKS